MVARDGQTVAPGTLDGIEHLVEFEPVPLARDLDVTEVQRAPGLATHLEELRDGLQELITFAPQVGDERSLITGQDLAERHQLPGVRETARRVDESSARPDGALLQRLGCDALESIELGVGHVPILVAANFASELTMGHEVAAVEASGVAFQAPQVVGHRAPVPDEVRRIAVQSGQRLAHALDVLGPDRRRRDAVLAEDLAADPLRRFHQERRVAEDAEIAVAVRVDERRGHDAAGHVERPIAGQVGGERGHTVAHDPQVETLTGTPPAVHHHAAAKNEIEHRSPPRGGIAQGAPNENLSTSTGLERGRPRGRRRHRATADRPPHR